jgi:hypothetical protein
MESAGSPAGDQSFRAFFSFSKAEGFTMKAEGKTLKAECTNPPAGPVSTSV